MSWDGYIDNLIGHTSGSCDKVAIIGLVGGASWTTSAHANHLNLTPAEGKTIADVMTNLDCTPFQTSGIMAEGVKYQFLRKDENTVYGKKKEHGCITMQKSKTAVVLAHTAEGKVPGNTNKGVDVIASYLESLNM